MQLPGLASLGMDPNSQTSHRESDTGCGAKGDGVDNGCSGCFFLNLIKARERPIVLLMAAEIGGLSADWKHFAFN